MVPPVAPLPFTTRLFFAWVCFFRVLFDGLFAAKVYALGAGGEAPRLEPKPEPEPTPEPEKKEEESKPRPVVVEKPPPSTDAALQLLALLQREGRFIDFIEEDVSSFSDADIGAAARIVHSGCRKALREHVRLEPVRKEEEGTKVTLDGSGQEVKLTGNVQGEGPHTGTLRHRGWRAVEIKLPVAVPGHDVKILAQAEVEL
jgi:hypothetical protein